MISLNGKNHNCCFVKKDIITLHNDSQLENLEKPMFLLLAFPLLDQIGTCVTIYKIVSLSFKYSICLLLSNGQFYIAQILNI